MAKWLRLDLLKMWLIHLVRLVHCLFVYLFFPSKYGYYLVSLGLDHNDATKSSLDVYKDYFEKDFLDATEVYYRTESEKFISENSIPDYMKKAEMRLLEEEGRIQMYLHPSTHKTLIPICENVLVRNQEESLWDGFQSLLDMDKQDGKVYLVSKERQ